MLLTVTEVVIQMLPSLFGSHPLEHICKPLHQITRLKTEKHPAVLAFSDQRIARVFDLAGNR